MPPRPTMGHRHRVRVEFGLTPDIAEAVYTYAKGHGLSLSEAGTRLLSHALTDQVGLTAHAEADPHPTTSSDRLPRAEDGEERKID